MTVRFILNDNEAVIQVEPHERLIDILRGHLGLTRAKSACHSGLCGACTVFFNQVITPSCLIPAFRIQGATVLTIEGFEKTREYQDIIEGFKRAGVENCGYCDAGKILVAESLLKAKMPPDKDTIVLAYDGIKCRCTDAVSLVNGVLFAAEIRKRRYQHAERPA
ncbi:MAG: 2Fe-2S iron-sulfur cluster binding domain-containing protein [Spirochaetaceae bacterium]|jgi:carbon-monoxide dehydrogenase small subunit|nr:2Fe-2S iron-sulfur cluster binding domain-containing protein [Spirochaetaceae bacterium]